MTEAAEKSVSFRAWVAVIGGLFGCFMAGMNVHVTSAALPEIEGSLGATFEEGSWISTAYLVAEIVMIPLTAWLVQVFSLRRVMLVGSFVFLVASIACSWAPNLQVMIIIRVIQGAAGGEIPILLLGQTNRSDDYAYTPGEAAPAHFFQNNPHLFPHLTAPSVRVGI